MENGRKTLSTSVDIKTARSFNDIAASFEKKPAALIREFIVGIVENRVKITPSENTGTKIRSDLYT